MENLYGRLEELLPLPLCCCEHNDLVANFMLEYPGHDDGVPARMMIMALLATH